MKNNFKHHVALNSHQDIAEIARTVFAQTKTNILNFIRLYSDGRVNYLCDNYAWMNHYLQAQFPSIGAFEQNTCFQQEKIILWHALADTDPIVVTSRTQFNIRYGITLTQLTPSYCDFFNFGTAAIEATAQSELMQSIPIFEQFIPYFYEMCRTQFPKLDDEAFKLSDFRSDRPELPPQNCLHLGAEFSYQYLTKQEISCAKALIRGLSYHDIALVLDISPRTVEKHVEHLKQKLQCANHCELGYRLAMIGICN
jgi:DNA-binding CsgD family transcriptional regulator